MSSIDEQSATKEKERTLLAWMRYCWDGCAQRLISWKHASRVNIVADCHWKCYFICATFFVWAVLVSQQGWHLLLHLKQHCIVLLSRLVATCTWWVNPFILNVWSWVTTAYTIVVQSWWWECTWFKFPNCLNWPSGIFVVMRILNDPPPLIALWELPLNLHNCQK